MLGIFWLILLSLFIDDLQLSSRLDRPLEKYIRIVFGLCPNRNEGRTLHNCNICIEKLQACRTDVDSCPHLPLPLLNLL